MDKTSSIDCYLYFMWNEWSQEVCVEMFGKVMGAHFWAKWVGMCEKHDPYGAPAPFYSELGHEARKIIADWSFKHYNHS